MNSPEFWKLIETARRRAHDDPDKLIDHLRSELVQLPEDQIIEFETLLRQKILDAYHENVLAAQKIIEGWVTDDSLLHFRCWLIAQGQKVFEETLRNPDCLAQIVEKDQSTDLEALLYVATAAFAEKTGRQEDETFPRNVCCDPALEYDMPTEPPKGQRWKNSDLPKMCPRLWAKFR